MEKTRRRNGAQFKAKVALETIHGELTMADPARAAAHPFTRAQKSLLREWSFSMPARQT